MPDLPPTQLALLSTWLGDWDVAADLSWSLQDITVLRLRTAAGDDVVAKASGTSHHIAREIRAYRRMVAPLGGRTPRLLHADKEQRLLVVTFLPGRLVLGDATAADPDTYRQAGSLLARLHRPDHLNAGYDGAAIDKIGELAGRATGLVPADQLDTLRHLAVSHHRAPRAVVPTHGDYQPRNWMIDDGVVSVIDWGRAGYRPWVTDFTRLHHQLADRPDLWSALLDGYGWDPAEEPDSWALDYLLQAVGTVVWAHDAGDAVFEAEGWAMVTRVVERWG